MGGKKKLNELINELKNIKKSYDHYENGDKIRMLEKHIDNILIDEKVYWKQRSKSNWRLEGDRNTKIFHAKATTRKQKNKIWGVLDEKGNWAEEAEVIERRFCDHFANFFTTINPSRQQREAALENIIKRVTTKMNEELTIPITKEEIKEAIFQMCPTKAPGSDALPVEFFQKYYNFVGEVVTATCLHILNEQGNLALLNHAYIALILKKKKNTGI